MKQNSVKTPAKGQSKITAFFVNRPTPKPSKPKEENQNEDPDIENREIDDSKHVKEEPEKSLVEQKEKHSVPTVFIDDDDEDQDKIDDKNKAVRDDDYDSDEVQKPRDKSKRAAEDPWSDDSPKLKRKWVQKKRKPAESDEIVEDGIIGMKVRSPNNSGLD